VSFVDDAVETHVDGKDGDYNKPSGDEVYEEPDSVRCEPAP
jgi:hypothetical protein